MVSTPIRIQNLQKNPEPEKSEIYCICLHLRLVYRSSGLNRPGGKFGGSRSLRLSETVVNEQLLSIASTSHKIAWSPLLSGVCCLQTDDNVFFEIPFLHGIFQFPFCCNEGGSIVWPDFFDLVSPTNEAPECVDSWISIKGMSQFQVYCSAGKAGIFDSVPFYNVAPSLNFYLGQSSLHRCE